MEQQIMTGSFELMKSLNRSLILNKIRELEPISRADLAKITKLTPPTVSTIVKELLETNVIMETTQGASNGGRKPTLIAINPKSYYIIGVDVGLKTIVVILTDLSASIIERQKLEIPQNIDKDEFLNLLKSGIQNILNINSIYKEKVIGIGVGMHGIIDFTTGTCLFAPGFGLRDIPIRSFLENEFNKLIIVENDARAMALGEYWFGNGKGTDPLVCINIGYGIGGGIIINGKIFRGSNHIAGEIGHITIDISGTLCECGNYGCLTTLAGGTAIANRAIKEIKTGRETQLTDLVNQDLDLITAELVYQAAQNGDSFSKELLRHSGRYLGIGLTNLIHTLNPSRIVLGGGVSKAGDFLLNNIEEEITRRGLTSDAKTTEITISKLGNDITSIGAVTLILQDLFSAAEIS